MFKDEVFELMKQVITSWEVIAVSIVLILFMNIVLHTAKAYHRPKVKRVKVKKEKPAAPLPEPEVMEDENEIVED
jgi:hypothetical protein